MQSRLPCLLSPRSVFQRLCDFVLKHLFTRVVGHRILERLGRVVNFDPEIGRLPRARLGESSKSLVEGAHNLSLLGDSAHGEQIHFSTMLECAKDLTDLNISNDQIKLSLGQGMLLRVCLSPAACSFVRRSLLLPS